MADTQQTQKNQTSSETPINQKDLSRQQNSQEQAVTPTQNQNTEFAAKGPLFDKSTIKKFALMGVIGVLILMILIVAGITISQILKSKDELQETPINTTEPVVIEQPKEKPHFAYIKNRKAIWIASTDGKDKNQILEIPAASSEYYTDIDWKTADILSYSKCSDDNKCSIESFNTKDKSSIVEVSQNNGNGQISRIKWDPKAKYLAFIRYSQDDYTINFKAGTVTQVFKTLKAQMTDRDIDSKLTFDNQGQYLAIYLNYKQIDEKDRNKEPIIIPTIYVYQPNGVIVDEIAKAQDPDFDKEGNLYYISDGDIILKSIGESNATAVTQLIGRNITMSADSTLIAYWDDKGGFANSRLNIYDLKQDIHRNILRGIILPKWISANEVVGIKPESCIGASCQLYEFQTTSLYILNIQDTSAENSVIQVDQGKTLSSLKYNYHADQR